MCIYIVLGIYDQITWNDFYRIVQPVLDVKFYEEPGFFLEKFLARPWAGTGQFY